MESSVAIGWRMNAFVPTGNKREPTQVPYLVAIADEKAAKRKVAKEAQVSIRQVETVSEVDEEVFADLGLETGEIVRAEIPQKLAVQEVARCTVAKATLQRANEPDETGIELRITTRNRMVYIFTFSRSKAEDLAVDLSPLRFREKETGQSDSL